MIRAKAGQKTCGWSPSLTQWKISGRKCHLSFAPITVLAMFLLILIWQNKYSVFVETMFLSCFNPAGYITTYNNPVSLDLVVITVYLRLDSNTFLFLWTILAIKCLGLHPVLTWLMWGFVSQDGIKPMWEDDRNKLGGRWLMTLSKQQRHNDLDRYWMETVSCGVFFFSFWVFFLLTGKPYI